MCQAKCPLYGQTRREADTARGKLVMLNGIIEEILTDVTAFSQKMDRCLLCGSCLATCPRQIDIPRVILEVRRIISAYHGMNPLEKFFLRHILAHPDRFHRLTLLAARGMDILKAISHMPGTRILYDGINKKTGHRHIRPLPAPFFLQTNRQHAPSPAGCKKGKGSILLFTGCLTDTFFPHVGKAAHAILTHMGKEVVIAPNQGCCGIPALASGDMKTFEDLVRHHVDLFSTVDYEIILSPCTTCTSVLKHFWPKFMKHAPPAIQEKIRAIAQKTMDMHQYLWSHHTFDNHHGQGRDAVPVTYHAPCHLTHYMGIHAEPLKLIRSNPCYQLIEMAGTQSCCGFGGTFNLKHYPISSAIGMKKRDQIILTNAREVITSCPACMIQLEDMFKKKEDTIVVRHILEILLETIQNKGNTYEIL